MSRKQRKPYRIIGAYDSETTNIKDGFGYKAFPILHQLGLLDCPITDVTSANVEQHADIELYRHTFELTSRLDEIVSSTFDYVPVIACHNLSFDMYPLAEWLLSHDVRVLAKSRQKPITFTILDENGHARLVIWDTLVFSQQPLEKMGIDCGYAKASGEWDYDLIRTPETPLTADELDYAKRDVYALIAWLSWWLKKNPDIEPEKLGLNVVTKTGVVRERMRVRFDQLKGNGAKYNVGRFWMFQNRTEAPKTDDELFTMHACTRGGFTFCASKAASIPYDLTNSDMAIAGFDATSQHPAQMVSHRYPMQFHETTCEQLELAFAVIGLVKLQDVLTKWSKPFPVAFNACFTFENLRPKKRSIFKKNGIFPLASARFQNITYEPNEDNAQSDLMRDELAKRGYRDTCAGGVFAFGKLESAKTATVYITELTAWEIWQCYEWDSVKAEHGYLTMRFCRPTDMSTISVMQFYKAKNVFKNARHEYMTTGTITNVGELLSVSIPENTVSRMQNGSLSDTECDLVYLGLKADLNSLFGVNATNEFRASTILGTDGIEYQDESGIACAPKNPKAWYQFGQRIVGWSRIAQICVMLLAAPHVKAIVNGDTDSVKFLMHESKMNALQKALTRYASALDKGKEITCKRVKTMYPRQYDSLEGIGAYVLEFTSKRFCASWNKAYCTHDVDSRTGKRKFAFTLAGIPTKDAHGLKRVNSFADELYEKGLSFEEICNIILGYNVTVSHTITRLNARSFPQWASSYFGRVTDYQGNTSLVAEPEALALYPMDKIINSFASFDNRCNYERAIANNPNVNSNNLLLFWDSKGRARYELL